MHRSLVAVGTSLAILAVTACSSTAQLEGGAGSDQVEGVAAPETLDSVAKRAAPKGGRSTKSPSEAPEGTTGERVSVAQTAFVAAAPRASAPVAAQGEHSAEFGPGVSARSIRVGVPYPPQTDKVNKLLYPEMDRPNFERVWNVVVDAINDTGGILGRRIEPVFLAEPTQEEICTYFTEEEPVIAVAGNILDAASCIDRAGTVPIMHGYTLESDFFRKAPHALAPLGISQWRATPLYIQGLLEQGFFEGDHKIGLVRWDKAPYPEITEKIVKPMLAGHGLEIEEELVITWPQGYHQIANAQAEGRSGVQRFKHAGIDRVLTLDEASYMLPEFTKYAEAQDYRPRYGVNSLNGGEWDMERKQLKGAMGIGWMPWIDLEPDDAYLHGSEGARACRDLMEAAGEGRQMDTFNEAAWTSSICDAALLLKAAIEAGGPSITQASIVAGAESLGTSFQSANTLLTRFGPGRHEGIAAIRFVRWFVRCQCFRYTSGLIDAG